MERFNGWSYDGTKLEDLGLFLDNKNLSLTPALVAGDIEADTLEGTLRQESAYGARTFELTGILLYPDSCDQPLEFIGQRKISVQRALTRLFSPLKDRPLVYGMTPERYIMCQRTGDIQRKDYINHSELSIQMIAKDPFLYEAPVTSTVTNGSIINVPGTMATGPIITVFGSVSGNRVADPYIEVNGVRATKAQAIGPGDVFVIDSHKRVSAYNNTQTVGFNDSYPMLIPGNNVILTNLAEVVIEYRPCWLT